MHPRLSITFFACALALLGCERTATPGTPDPNEPTEVDAPARRDQVSFDRLEGFWEEEQARAILERTERFEVRADLEPLSTGERVALERLLRVGVILQDVFEESRHADALTVRTHLAELEVPSEEQGRLDALRELYRLASGPVIRSLDGERETFAPVLAYQPGRNVYPPGVEREPFRAWLEAHPDVPDLTATRSVVRRRTAGQLSADRRTLARHRWLEALHPGLADRFEGPADETSYYAVPYSLAYAEQLLEASGLLFEAAGDVREGDADLADYLEQRARDLLTNDYEAGDAAWVSGSFGRLNVQVGAYETYDDALLSQKAFHSTSILIRAPEASAELSRAVAELSSFEAALPGGPYGAVRSQIPIGIYDVVADFGQSRGGNTASILPNEAHVTRKYGRTILIRRNVITNEVFLDLAQRRFRAAVADVHSDDLGPRGNFDRTVWHEVGHYLGPKTTESGAVVTEALGDLHNHIEELKADLVSLWLMPRLVELGVLDEERRRAAYAAGVLRVLVTVEPERSSPYRTMQLMQQNWLLDRGVLRFDAASGRLSIDYAAYPAAVEAMLTEVLAIQHAGGREAAEAFITRWAIWDEAVQGVLGEALDGVSPRYFLPSYPILEE